MSNKSLASTEKRLIRMFVIGIFLFLIVFEAIFLMSRVYLENRTQYQIFNNETNRIINSVRDTDHGAPRRPLLNIGFVVLDNSGQVITSQVAGQDIKNISDLLDRNLVDTLPFDTIQTEENLLLRKVAKTEQGETLLFIAPASYPIDTLIRDILRFLLLDVVIMIPFWFMARIYVRETLEPVKENLDTMTHFVHDAGHELKTPLAIISGNMQVLRDSKTPDMGLVDASLATIDHMNESIQGLLELADLKLPDRSEKTIIQPLIQSIIDQQKRAITEKKLDLFVNIGSKATVMMSEKHFSMLMHNLIENAIKYNKPNGSIDISLKGKTLTIRDTGIGIDTDEQSRIFDRFYRADAASTQSGSGIGLTIVERILKLYGWQIHVESILGSGTSIGITTK